MKDNLVLSNLFHRPARTFVSIFGIAVGVLLIMFTIGLADGTLRGKAREEANVGAEIMFRASGAIGFTGSDAFRLPVAYAAEIAGLDGVQMAVPIGQNLVAAKENNFGSRLVDGIIFDEYSQLSGLHIVSGRAIGAAGDEAIVDTGWAESKKLKIGDALKMYERDFTLVGMYEPAVGGGRIKIPLATMQEQLGGNGKCTNILIKVKDASQQEAVAERISQKFPDNPIVFTKDLEELYSNSIPALNVFLNVVIGVAAAISGLIILLTMYTTVTERTRQIGIMKSLGMSKSGIAWTITQEALLISFLGVILGVLLTVCLRFILTKTTTMQVNIEWQLIFIILFVGLIGGALGALYPAIRAARLDAVEALSYE
ncbi:MAG: FtsX-like permease family protein [Pyrinomonadaceae bacterium]